MMSEILDLVTEEEVQFGLRHIQDGVVTRRYVPMVEAVAGAIRRGAEKPMLIDGRLQIRNFCAVPAVQATVEATLATCNLPSVQERLPREIAERAMVAKDCAIQIIQQATAAELFLAQIFTAGPVWQDILNRDKLEIINLLEDPERLDAFGAELFEESAFGIGAGHNLLSEYDMSPDNHLDRIQRSTGLLAITSVDSNKLTDVFSALGWPYALPSSVRRTRAGLVTFTAAAHAVLREHTGRGCTGGAVAVRAYGPGTLLKQAWRNTAAFYLHNNATSSAKNTKPPQTTPPYRSTACPYDTA